MKQILVALVVFLVIACGPPKISNAIAGDQPLDRVAEGAPVPLNGSSGRFVVRSHGTFDATGSRCELLTIVRDDGEVLPRRRAVMVCRAFGGGFGIARLDLDP